MQDHRTAHTLDGGELATNVQVIEAALLLLGQCDLSHHDGDEDELRGRVGRSLAWLQRETNLAALEAGRSMDDLPYDEGDIYAAELGDLTRRERWSA